jgi:hypothetical protein
VNFEMATTFDVSDACEDRIDGLLQRHTVFNGRVISPYHDTLEQQIGYDRRSRNVVVYAITGNLILINDNDPKCRTFWTALAGRFDFIDESLLQSHKTDFFRGIADFTCRGEATHFHVSPISRNIFTWYYGPYVIQAFCNQDFFESFYMRVRKSPSANSDSADSEDSEDSEDYEQSGAETDEEESDRPRDLARY